MITSAFAVESLIAEGHEVVARNTVTGTHRGEYLGMPPTGRRITYNEVFIVRFANGRIVESWGIVDVLRKCANPACPLFLFDRGGLV